MVVCKCSMFCCTLLYVHSSIAIILMGKRELVALLYLSSWCLVMVERLFLAVARGCLRFVIVVFPDHTHLLFFYYQPKSQHFFWIINQQPKFICAIFFSKINPDAHFGSKINRFTFYKGGRGGGGVGL